MSWEDQFSSLSPSVVCWYLLQTVWTQIRPDDGTSGLIWFQTVWHSDGIPKRIFQKSWFWKKSADKKKHAKFPRRQRVNPNGNNKAADQPIHSGSLNSTFVLQPTYTGCILIFKILTTIINLISALCRQLFQSSIIWAGPWRDKTCILGFWQSETQTSLLG